MTGTGTPKKAVPQNIDDTELGRTGVRVPRLGLGAMTWGNPAEIPRWSPARLAYGLAGSLEEQQRALDVSIEAGANLVDTAAMYGKGASERRVGKLARGKNVMVATKFPFRIYSGAGRLPADLEASLTRLARVTIDLYQVHYPAAWRPIPRLMQLMADAVEAGKVRAVGVSNFSAAQMRTAHAVLASRGIPLASNQVQYSLLHRQPEVDGVIDTCRELGVTLIAYMPLASGALTGKYTAAVRPSGMRTRMAFFNQKNQSVLMGVIEILREIGSRYGMSPSQVALRWLIENGALPIPGAKTGEQAAHNARALSFSLSRSEVEALSQATLPWRT
ncbi:MAG TPA: aldo/keto reductase [Candidatus Dormibacteraeota bacterium]